MYVSTLGDHTHSYIYTRHNSEVIEELLTSKNIKLCNYPWNSYPFYLILDSRINIQYTWLKNSFISLNWRVQLCIITMIQSPPIETAGIISNARKIQPTFTTTWKNTYYWWNSITLKMYGLFNNLSLVSSRYIVDETTSVSPKIL